jgi:hypothetical protein
MPNYAIVINNYVVNTISAESKESAEQCYPNCTAFEYTPENPIGIGWTYNGTEFFAPEIE